jgi:hypothetical protein
MRALRRRCAVTGGQTSLGVHLHCSVVRWRVAIGKNVMYSSQVYEGLRCALVMRQRRCEAPLLCRIICGARAAHAAVCRRSLRVYATIPAPESSPAVSELGWPVDFAQHYVKVRCSTAARWLAICEAVE